MHMICDIEKAPPPEPESPAEVAAADDAPDELDDALDAADELDDDAEDELPPVVIATATVRAVVPPTP